MKIKLLLKKIIQLFLGVMALCNTAFSQSIQLKGTVVDSAGISLPGASVKVKGTNLGAITDGDGKFTIACDSKGELIVSSVGFAPKTVAVNGRNTLQVTLQYEAKGLNEVVVTALGIKRDKRLLTYATQEIKGDEIVKAKQPNIINSLEGKLAGVQITSSSGTPGSSVNVVIRGATSVLGNNQALIVLDGVPIDNSETGALSSGAGSSRIADIDPNTIESVNVLRGAAATALYGSAGARG